jgi:hypothetical protein
MLKKEKTGSSAASGLRDEKPPGPALASEESGKESPALEQEDVKYLEVLVLVFESLLGRLKDLGLERKDKQQTIQLMKKLVMQAKLKDRKLKGEDEKQAGGSGCSELDMRYIYDTFFEDHWLNSSTILNIAQLGFLTPDDVFFTQTNIQEEVCPEVTVEKITLLAVCFYAMSTEYRFKEKIEEIKDNGDKKSVVQKETNLIVSRFKDMDVHKKLADLDSLPRQAKLKALEAKNFVTNS